MKGRTAFVLPVVLFLSSLISNTALPTAASNQIGSAGEDTVETWSFNFTLRLPAAYICFECLSISYLHPDHDPPVSGCGDFDPEQIPELSEFAGNLFPIVPIGDKPLEIEVARTGDDISSSFEFTHDYTGHLITADLSGSIVGDQVSFTIAYHLPSGLQDYSMPLNRCDVMTEMEGTVYYTLPAELIGFYQGTLHDDEIEGTEIWGTFNSSVEEEFAVWSFQYKEYVARINPFTGGLTRDYLWLDAVAEWRFSNLRIRGSFTVNADRVPVLLVHGWGLGSARSWDEFKKWLEADGYHVEVLEYDNSEYIDVAARELSQKVQEMLLYSDKIDIIAHSYGGLVSRYYIEAMGGNEYIRKLIMLATPNHGSELADILTDPEDLLAKSITEFLNAWMPLLIKKFFGSNPRTMDSTYHLRTTDNPTLENLNSGLDLSKLGTRYFVIAGTRHTGVLSLTSRLLGTRTSGHNDGVVTVDSASLESKGAPIYCVGLSHNQIVSALAEDMYNRIVLPILQDSVPDPLTISCNCPESEDSDDTYIREVLEYAQLAAMLGDTVNGTFQVADEYDLLEVGIVFPSCDFNFTLVSPTGIKITPESANQTSNVNYFMLENYWYYLIRNPETGKWQYDIVVIDVPEEGVDIGFISFEVIPEFPSQLVLPLFMMLTLLAAVAYRRKRVCTSSV